MMTDQHLNTGSMALGSLPDDEAAEFADHLSTCPTCAAELAGFLETAAILGSSVAQAPPASLRRSVMQAAARTPQLPPLTASPAPASLADPALGRHRQPSAPESAPVPDVSEPDRLATVTALRPWYRRPQALIAAAVAALVIGGGGGAFLASRSAGPSSVASGANCVAAASDKAVLTPSVGSGGTVTLVPSCDTAVVKIPALPAAPAGKVYQIWVIKGSDAASIGVVENNVDGSFAAFSTPVHAGDSAVGVTLEPAPGSAKPTTAPFWVVPFST